MFKLTLFSIIITFLLATSNDIQAADTLGTIDVISEYQNEQRKIKEKVFYKPYTKQIVSETTIKEEGIPDIAEAVRDIPGVNVTEGGAFNKTIKIRGLRGPRVVTLIDGIKLSNQGMTHTGAGETGMQDIANVKLIEVIKGSPAVVYAPGSSGGVINIITHKSPLKKGFGIEQRLGYDQGYDKKSSTTIVDASTGDIGIRLSHTRNLAEDYRIKGDKEKKLAISFANQENAMSPNFLEIKNLGYNTESTSARISAKAGYDGVIDIDWNNWTGKDMSLIHGPSIQDATIIQYDRMDRNSHSISYRKDSLGLLSNLNIKYSKQDLFQAIEANAIGVKLKSEQLNIISNIILDNSILTVGAETIQDRAKTLVYSSQDYYGAFANLEYFFNNWTLFGGARFNQWTTTQKIFSDTNQELAKQLVGISGITPPKTITSPTTTLGIQYAINEQSNLSLNLSSTFRNPDLMERYSFSSTIGGGIDMKPEEGKHAELIWKYLSKKTFISTSLFYSEFKNYIWTKEIRRLKNSAGLNECLRLGLCNPAIGEFNNMEREFFDIHVKYYNSAKVINQGAEFTVEYAIPQHEVVFRSSFNEIKSDDPYVKSAAHPIDTNISYRYEFNSNWRPWVKAKGQYVLDVPKVTQHLGFDAYALFSLYAGFNKNNFIFSSGIRNLADKEYRAPYSGINGLARTFFMNVSYKWHSNNE